MTGPLSGLRIIELAGLGPGPFAAMMLADHGAEVIRIEREGLISVPGDPMLRGRRSIALDLKWEHCRTAFTRLVESADGLIDPFRPGKLEALGLGPDRLQSLNPRLVIGRISGWGQYGPRRDEAGHDINYLALSGLLDAIGPADRPAVPLNLVADYAGGGMMLAFSMAACLREMAAGADKGRVIDCAMSDGAALVGSLMFALRNAGQWTHAREANLLDGGAPIYGCYRCADGRFLALGAIEPQFHREFLTLVGLVDDPRFASLLDRNQWPVQRAAIAAAIEAKPLDHWTAIFEGSDVCVTPVLALDEAVRDPHHVARGSFAEGALGPVPAPAPRYGPEPAPLAPPHRPGADGAAVLAELGFDEEEIEAMLSP
ncbi:CaiB/BaiF CoA transferase family protein [Sphingomicrobium lutaoense]|uniref:Alpha-methylacyl-CoA racemase n=1 Tax=Sphingomicrobium lutaoense TaxID=515949 RepID=A0A839Z1B1_9SPHN|nr:CaiB/BaiF CoA-transferase family protein [Sphingomicrobium lutaoense]MBB3763462.1 alpha-methylacyl-CoA racemase [Sphingomicrobium lutaoense]